MNKKNSTFLRRFGSYFWSPLKMLIFAMRINHASVNILRVFLTDRHLRHLIVTKLISSQSD